MADPITPHRLPTVEEYLALEEESTVRREYVAGMLYAHAGDTSRHNAIAANVLAALWNAARGCPCRLYGSDMRLHAADDVFYYPDVMVVCGDNEAGDEALYQHAPCLVVEITSPSTEPTNRREKVFTYRKIPSLRAYLIVDQDRRWVERHWRDESGEWRQGGASQLVSTLPSAAGQHFSLSACCRSRAHFPAALCATAFWGTSSLVRRRRATNRALPS